MLFIVVVIVVVVVVVAVVTSSERIVQESSVCEICRGGHRQISTATVGSLN